MYASYSRGHTGGAAGVGNPDGKHNFMQNLVTMGP
jgi:hypothetical protein